MKIFRRATVSCLKAPAGSGNKTHYSSAMKSVQRSIPAEFCGPVLGKVWVSRSMSICTLGHKNPMFYLFASITQIKTVWVPPRPQTFLPRRATAAVRSTNSWTCSPPVSYPNRFGVQPPGLSIFSGKYRNAITILLWISKTG